MGLISTKGGLFLLGHCTHVKHQALSEAWSLVERTKERQVASQIVDLRRRLKGETAH